MSINRYELHPPDSYPRVIQVDGTISINQILHLKKPMEDRSGQNVYRQYKVLRHRSEMRETSESVMELIAILDLERVEE